MLRRVILFGHLKYPTFTERDEFAKTTENRNSSRQHCVTWKTRMKHHVEHSLTISPRFSRWRFSVGDPHCTDITPHKRPVPPLPPSEVTSIPHCADTPTPFTARPLCSAIALTDDRASQSASRPASQMTRPNRQTARLSQAVELISRKT